MAEPPTEIIHKALVEAFDSPLASARAALADRLAREIQGARAAAAESLSVSVRRLRQAASITEIGSTLLETASAYCGRAALLIHQGDLLTGWRAHGFNGVTNASRSEVWSRFQVSLDAAPALAQAIESREAVVALGLPDQVSPRLSEMFALGSEEKIYLFPLCLRDTVVAVLCADSAGSAEGVQPAALELLCSVAEIAMEALSSRRSDEPATGRLELPLAGRTTRPIAEWDQMSPAERDIHLRAQRFARVLVADLQLYRAQEIREGRKSRDLYGRLKEDIDKSREAYQRRFPSAATAGIDYFHIELVRTVAEEQEQLLGPEYPGPALVAVTESS